MVDVSCCAVSVIIISCPSCKSNRTVKNGRIQNGKQNYRCRDCGRQFVQDPQNKVIDPMRRIVVLCRLQGEQAVGVASH
jgi:transposase-like protein